MGAPVCDLSLSEHGRNDCADPGHAKALETRRAGAPPWSALIRRDEGVNGWRHYLDGQPIHCGTGLELQSIEWKADDYGEFTVRQPAGVRVRYETSGDHVVLYADIGGHEFTCGAEPWMRFRWPERR